MAKKQAGKEEITMSKNLTPGQASEQLMTALAANKGPGSLVRLAGEIMDNPVAVGDTSLTILFTSGNMPEGVPMTHPGMIPPEFTTDHEFIKYNEEAYYEDTPIVTPPQYGGYCTILTRLKVHRQIVGYLSVLLAKHPLRENDIELVCLIRTAVEVELGKNTSALSQPPRPWEFTLKNLLSGKENPLQNNADLTISLGIDKNARLYVLVFKMLGYSKANTPGLAIRRELLALTGSKISVLYEGNIIIIRQGYLHTQPTLTAPYPKLSDFLKKYGIVCGISTAFNQITELGRHYVQACSAIRYFAPRQGAGIYKYENAAVFLFLQQHQKNIRLMDYCHPGIIALKSYDKKNRTNYTQVLKCYVENGKNAMLTASRLRLSKASVYRILERIRKITGQSAETPGTLFNLYFSILLIEQQEAEHA